MSSFLLNPLTLPQPQNQFHQNGLSQALLPTAYSRPDYRHASHSPPQQQPSNNPASPLTFNVQAAAQQQQQQQQQQSTTTSPALKRKQIDQTSALGLKRRRETNAGGAAPTAGSSSNNNASSSGQGAAADDGDGYDMDSGNAGAKHWTDEEKSRLFNWLMGPGQEDHWNALRATKNSCLRECAQEVFGARKTYQALKGCYERNFNLFKQIYAFESAHGQPAGAPHLANLSEADRLREYERRLSAVRKTTDVGSITARTIDHWHRVGWYDLFYRRWHGDPATTRPIQQQGGHARNNIAGGSSNSNNANANANTNNSGNNANNNTNDDGDGDDDTNSGANNNLDFQDSHSHSSGLGGLQQQQAQQQHGGMGGHGGHGMHERQQSHQQQQQQQHYTINPQDLRDPSSSAGQQQAGRHQAPGLHSQQSSSHLTQQQQHHGASQQGQNQGQQPGQQGQQQQAAAAQQQAQQHGMHGVPGSVMGLTLNQQHLNALHGAAAGAVGSGSGEGLSNYFNAALGNAAAGMGVGVGVVGVGMGGAAGAGAGGGGGGGNAMGGPSGMGVGVNPGASSSSGMGSLNPVGTASNAGVGAGGGAATVGATPIVSITLPSDLAARWVHALTLQNQLAQEKLEYLKRRESRELKEFAARKEMEKTVNNRVKSEKAFELIGNPNADPQLKQAATDYLRKQFLQD